MATSATTRTPLSRERVLRAAVELADTQGIKALTMRNLAQELGVEAMSLYYHVANKEEVLDGIVDVVIEEINDAVRELDRPTDAAGWKDAIRTRILTAREVLLRHSWTPGVLETRTNMSGPTLDYFDSLTGLFRQNGFSLDLTHHALHALGSRALGFTQELYGSEEKNHETDPEVEAIMMGEMAERYPYITEIATEISHGDPDSTLGWCDDQVEFEFGLDLLLTGLELLRDSD